MLKFITDVQNEAEPDILTDKCHETLRIISLEGQLLATYNAPLGGWTHAILVKLSHTFPSQWNVCGADALVGKQFVGSTEI